VTPSAPPLTQFANTDTQRLIGGDTDVGCYPFPIGFGETEKNVLPIYSEKLLQKLNYIRENPVRAG
jgi:hypothetical protein